jgi:hypothetical protein
MTLEEAQTAVDQLPFPEMNPGDIVWYPGRTKKDQPENEWGYRFIRQSDAWVHHPVED